ncbi:MAG TPA: endolytic transglycosylase MltG [Patescibacteria group bacterium]|nr:endolytic transglycosylase MltG [Patescibacteria group bacterium]
MKTKIILIVVIILAISIYGYTIYSKNALEKAISMPNSATKTSVTFEIKPGESMSAVASNLKKATLMVNNDPFIKYAKKNELDKKIKAGVYTLNTAMSPKEILEVFVSGSRSEVWITIPEGWRIDQIASYLEKQGLFKAKEFEDEAYVKNFSSTPFLAGLPGKTTLEGYLFPDTYKVFSDAKPADVIQVMLDNFGKKVTKDMMDSANKQGFSLHQFITLTSIIEKESAHSEDIRKISSVYHNRLAQDMPFQSDATITYITRRADARPSIDETKIDSPYNTYLNKGLPPGPVGNPGVAAMEATLNPEKTDYLFFVSQGNRAYFAKTYEEHLENIAKYLD